MTKKEGNSRDAKNNGTQSGANKSIRLPNVAAKLTKAKRHKKAVKFADPLAEHRLYERQISPKDEIEQQMKEVRERDKLESRPKSDLRDLEPPLSLVAQLDLARKKLVTKPEPKPSDTLSSQKNLKSSKSIKSFKSSKSVMETKSSKRV